MSMGGLRTASNRSTSASVEVLTFPIGGSNYGAALAGTNNANTYYRSAVCGILSWGFNSFVFEAYDEPWKPGSIGDNGQVADETHWGVMTAARQIKYSLRC